MSKKLAEKMTSIKKNANKKKKAKATREHNEKEKRTKQRVSELKQRRIDETKERIKEAAQDGKSFINVSALESDAVEFRLLNAITAWADEEGFKLRTSYTGIYTPPHCSDDDPSDYRHFLTIGW